MSIFHEPMNPITVSLLIMITLFSFNSKIKNKFFDKHLEKILTLHEKNEFWGYIGVYQGISGYIGEYRGISEYIGFIYHILYIM